jgi:hypothetical protein
MDIFKSLDCMVASGVITQAQADSIQSLAKWLNGLQEEEILMFIAATQIIKA